MNSYFKYLSLCALVAVLMAGCEFPPNLPDEPAITFDNITKITDINGNDSLAITITYQDGDGNLGLDIFDVNDPFQQYLDSADRIVASDSINIFHYNYHISMMEKENGVFVPFTPIFPTLYDSIQLYGRFRRLINEDDPNRPVEGRLTFGLQTLSGTLTSQFHPNDTLKFKIRIVDRDRNFSNTIQTDEVVVNIP